MAPHPDSTAAPRQPVDLIVAGGLVVTMDARRRVIADGAVAIATGRIVAVDSRDRIDASFTAAERLDASGQTVIPGLINGHAHLRPWLDHWLAGQGLALPEVETWAVHPGGPRILRAVLASAGLQPAQIDLSTEVLSQFGNMSSATILFILERLRSRAGSGPCLALGFGPGLTVEAALLMRQE